MQQVSMNYPQTKGAVNRTTVVTRSSTDDKTTTAFNQNYPCVSPSPGHYSRNIALCQLHEATKEKFDSLDTLNDERYLAITAWEQFIGPDPTTSANPKRPFSATEPADRSQMGINQSQNKVSTPTHSGDSRTHLNTFLDDIFSMQDSTRSGMLKHAEPAVVQGVSPTSTADTCLFSNKRQKTSELYYL